MIAIIRATCRQCGVITLTAAQVQAKIIEAGDQDETQRSFSFSCPLCKAETVSPTDRDTVLKLAAVGVKVHHVRIPEEAREGHDGPSLTLDDLIDFHCRLEELTTFPSELLDR